MKKVLAIAFASALLVQVSCRKDDEQIVVPKGEYGNGYLITNEGNFGTPNASIDFISNALSGMESEIYKAKNNEDLGDVLQSVTFSGDDAYLVVNNSNKVVVANRYTMEKKAQITEEIASPRYAAFANNQLYVTNSAYGGAQFVSVYNQAHELVKKIDFTMTVEEIHTVGGQVFVQNASFGNGNQYSFINPSDNTITGTYSVPEGNIVNSRVYEGKLYLLVNGTANAYIHQVETNGSIAKTYTISGMTNAKNLDIENGNFFFTAGNMIYKNAMDMETITPSEFITVQDNSWSTLYGFEVIGDKVFTSDAKGFTEASEVTVYSAGDGSVLKTLTAGMGTSGFYQNN
ncbi:MAG: hypothetical protein CSA38_01275 [Flavobacteriales bacterium]|nr:MAG: hypothetical protein CSA38_01275 [Flavobacteriales bacterium]